VVTLVVLACVLRATTKKVVNFSCGKKVKKCTPEKILATPMSTACICGILNPGSFTDSSAVCLRPTVGR